MTLPAASRNTSPRCEDNSSQRKVVLAMEKSHIRNSTNPIHPILDTLRRERVRRRLSLSSLAAILGYHPVSIDTWECGKRIPKFQAVLDWAQSLGYEIKLERRITATSDLPSNTPQIKRFSPSFKDANT